MDEADSTPRLLQATGFSAPSRPVFRLTPELARAFKSGVERGGRLVADEEIGPIR